MNPYRQIAMEHLSIKELEGIIAEIKRRGSPQVLSEEQQHRNHIKMKLFKSLNY